MNFSTFSTNKIVKKTQLGFTLIELLIVIAVLGVLAAVVLTAINPAEQLARGRDAGRLQEIDQIGHALAQYYTAQGGNYLTGGNTAWMTNLVQSGELPQTITVPAGGLGTCPAADTQGGFCYVTFAGPPAGFGVWTMAESKTYDLKSAGPAATNGCHATTATSFAVFVYDSIDGKSGVYCAANGASWVPSGALGANLY